MKGKAMYQYTDGGLQNVWLANGYTEQNTKHGKAIAFDDGDGLNRAIGLALVKKPSSLTGIEFRYLRQSLLMSQASLGNLLGFTNQAIALWEKERQKLPRAADIALRAIYASAIKGDEQIKNIVTAINETERVILIMSETAKGWTAKQTKEAEFETA